MPNSAHISIASSVTRHVGVVMLPGFSMLAQACATEPMQVANRLSGQTLYRLTTFALDEGPVASASGQQLVSQSIAGEPKVPLDMLLVCATLPLPSSMSEALLDWLRRLSAVRVVLGGIGGGVEVLARAGVLDGYRVTLPWPRFAAFAEEYPGIRLSRQLFEIDRDRLTCGGGTAAMDMMMTLIGSLHGDELAQRISEHFVLERIRMGDEPQEVPLRTRLKHAPQSLLDALAMMEANVEEPLTTHELSEHLGISRRQLERLFKKYLQAVPSRYYLNLRLQVARRLLRESDLSAGDIALRTGFSSAAHFSTAYRHHFDMTPREERL